MGKKIEKKRFQEPQEMIRNIVFLSIMVSMGLWLTISVSFMNESKIYELYANRELIGGSHQRLAISLQRFAVSTFGKNGLTGLLLISDILMSLALLSRVSAYRRYKYKCKLYQEGVIKNFFDIYDDKPSFSIFGIIRKIFKKKYKHKENLSNKQIEKKMDDYFKKIKGD